MSTVLNPPAPPRHALPDPGETVPSFSWPIAGIFASALALFATGTWLALEGRLPGFDGGQPKANEVRDRRRHLTRLDAIDEPNQPYIPMGCQTVFSSRKAAMS